MTKAVEDKDKDENDDDDDNDEFTTVADVDDFAFVRFECNRRLSKGDVCIL